MINSRNHAKQKNNPILNQNKNTKKGTIITYDDDDDVIHHPSTNAQTETNKQLPTTFPTTSHHRFTTRNLNT
jgi:hypothetical protein